jgi:hypothetical protein
MQVQTTEASFGEATMRGSSDTQPPRSLAAANLAAANHRQDRGCGDSETAEFMEALERTCARPFSAF